MSQQPQISIITAVHNQLPMNRLFLAALQRATANSFELIVVDNASTDASASFFEAAGATVVRNARNYSYPRSQNQGIALARGSHLAFLNNDVIASQAWDQILLDSMVTNSLDVVTACGIERVESRLATRRLRQRWDLIRNLLGLLGSGERTLAAMHRLMYPDWPGFCAQRHHRFSGKTVLGFVGNTVMMSRRALDLVGPWDERIQAADHDLYLRVATRARDFGDIRPVHVALDCYMHHYIRLTQRGDPQPFADRANLIEVDRKWARRDLALLDEPFAIAAGH